MCCLVRFDEKLFVFKYCFIFIVLGQDTSTQGSREGKDRCDKGSNRDRASLSAVDNMVIKPSVKLIQSNIKVFK